MGGGSLIEISLIDGILNRGTAVFSLLHKRNPEFHSER
jgi:hypothetical protein